MKTSLKAVLTVLFLFSITFVGAPAVSAARTSSPNVEFIPKAPSQTSSIGFYSCSSTSACPMGVADYGVNGKSDYSYQASTFVSWVNFTKLTIGTSPIGCPGGLTDCMTVQQNTVDYKVFEKDSSGIYSGTYWIQDVPFIGQSGKNYQINLVDNIWNFSSTTASMTQPIYGNLLGKCSGVEADGYYYCDGTQTIETTLPFEVLMNTTTGVLTSGTHSGSTYVEFGIWVYHSGTLVGGGWYDEIAFKGKASSSPSINVGGMNPYGTYNDAETVMCGPGDGSTVTVSAVTAKMTESYLPIGSTTLTSIPHAYSAGTDTAETVLGVHMTSSVVGTGTAKAGADDNKKLW
jgi:hypothetical protein